MQTVDDTPELAALKASLADTLTRNHRIVLQFTADVSDEAALAPLVAEGSHMNWLVGHLVGNRNSMLRALGAEAVRAEAEDEEFGYGSSPSGEAAKPLAQQVRDYDLTHVALLDALKAASPELLASNVGRNSVKERVSFLTWHETYHLGQLMLYRRAAGLDSPIG